MDRREDLKRCVSRFRNAILESGVCQEVASFYRFPAGACGITSRLLGAYLDQMGFGEFQKVNGTVNVGWRKTKSYSHAWLEKDGVLVDITGSQFEFIPDEITITTSDVYRKYFRDCQCSPYWTEYDGAIGEDRKKHLENDRLWESYLKIIRQIEG